VRTKKPPDFQIFAFAVAAIDMKDGRGEQRKINRGSALAFIRR